MIEFDFRLHADRSGCSGTQYFELLPGPYQGKHWVPGARFIHENTFCLVEGIFENRVPEFDHFAFVDVPGVQWTPILADLAALRDRLHDIANFRADVPFGSTLRVEDDFALDCANNQRRLAVLIQELENWLRETLNEHECISVLGL